MRWSWIDRILELEPGRRIVAIKNLSFAEEFFDDHFRKTATTPGIPIMPASLIIEGMAQTAGVLVGHAERFREKVILAKIGVAELDEDIEPGRTIRFTATIDRLDRQGAATSGVVEVVEIGPAGAMQTRRIGRIDLIFSHIDQNMAGLGFPEHNFVFGESFQTLLRISDVAW
ncbi:MAG: beta-hydroxyacyl-ACP dehydratase [Phycisphaerae bacterium]|nr:beta-hydroxyacyl-ACP dehydratase [Phycisphaerae bacterium]